MDHRCPGKRLFSLAVVFLCSRAAGAQPILEHEPLRCLPRGEFTEIFVTVQPSSSIRSVKMYFRSSFYPEFYFLEMSGNEAGAFSAVLPMPTEETTKVVYYFEAIDLSFQTSRSAETEVAVSGDAACDRGPGGVLFARGAPAILVGTLHAGASAIPAGFQAAGITGFLSAAGAAASTGGIGIGVAVGAAAGAAAGVGVLVTRDDAASSTTSAPPSVGNASLTSTVSTTAGPSTSSISATTSIAGVPTSTSSGPSTSSSSSTTTIGGGSTTSATTTSPPSLTACFTWQALGNCRVAFDSCSTPEDEIARYEWRMLGPPVPEPPQAESFTFSFDADPRCRREKSFNHPVRLTVYDRTGRIARVQKDVTVRSAEASSTEDVGLAFKSVVATFPPIERAVGRVVVNGVQLAPTTGAFPALYETRVRTGTIRIEAVLASPVAPGSLWELDFSSSERMVPGSLRPESGAVVSADDRRVVFRLEGNPGESVRVRLEAR
jgi:hypothetical protein